MARVYLDEDVSVLLATLLRARNINVLTARDADMLGASDDAHLKFASRANRILLTHNRIDFELLFSRYVEQSISQAGIIVLSRKRDVYLTSHRLIKFLASHPTAENQLWYL